MTLDKCQKDRNYQIASVDMKDKIIQERFAAFGIVKGAIVKLLCTSLKYATFSIQINNAQIALRKEEAKLIKVKSLDSEK